MTTTLALQRGIRFRDLVLFYVVVSLAIRWTAFAASAGPSILIVWIAALIGFFLPLAACVMELSSRHPDEGGLYVWVSEAFGDFPGFIAAWTYWMSNLPLFPSLLYFSAASALLAFGSRAQLLAASPSYFIAVSTLCLALITLLNIRGVNIGKWLNNIGAFGSLLALTVLMLLAFASWWRFGPATHFTTAGLVPHWSAGNAVFWSTVFLAFVGVEAGSAMGGEIQNPRRNIPWAILLGGGLIAFGYIGGTLALLVALPSQATSGPDGFVNGIHALTAHLGLGWLLAPMVLLVAFSAFGGAAANLSSTARLPFVVGIHHYLPDAFGWTHPRYRTPWVAIAVYGAAGMVMALVGQAGTSVRGAYEVLVSMTILPTFVPFLFVFAAMIRLQSRPVGPQVRRVPGGKPVAIALGCLGLASTVLTLVMSVVPADDEPNKPLAIAKVLGGTLVLVGAGVAVFIGARLKARNRAAFAIKTCPPSPGN
jgi:amino acid transporter